LCVAALAFHSRRNPVGLCDQPSCRAAGEHRIILQRLVVINGAIANPVGIDRTGPRQFLLLDPVEKSVAPQRVPMRRAPVELGQAIALALAHTRLHCRQCADSTLHEFPDIVQKRAERHLVAIRQFPPLTHAATTIVSDSPAPRATCSAAITSYAPNPI